MAEGYLIARCFKILYACVFVRTSVLKISDKAEEVFKFYITTINFTLSTIPKDVVPYFSSNFLFLLSIKNMKLINKDILTEYGFVQDEAKSSNNKIVMTREKMDVVINTDGTIWYSNMGFDYPLKDLASLRKVYKEVRNTELKPVI